MANLRNIWAGDNVDANQGICLGLGAVISCGDPIVPPPSYPAKPDFTTMTFESSVTITSTETGAWGGATTASTYLGAGLVRPSSASTSTIETLDVVSGTTTPYLPSPPDVNGVISDGILVVGFAPQQQFYELIDMDTGASTPLALPTNNAAVDNALFGNNGMFYSTRTSGGYIAGWKEFDPIGNIFTGVEIAKQAVGFNFYVKFDSDNFVYHTGSDAGTLYRCNKTSDGGSVLETAVSGSPTLQTSDKAFYLDGKVYVLSGNTMSIYGVS